jgi:hypothetical protein
MAYKFIKWAVCIVLIIAFIYLVIKWIKADQKDSFADLIDAKEKQLEMIFTELNVAKAKKACLDQMAKWKTTIVTYLILFIALSISLICGFYHQDTLVSVYVSFKDSGGYLITILGLLMFKKFFTINTFIEMADTCIKNREYRINNFDPECIPAITAKANILSHEIMELKNKQLHI